MSKYNRFHSLFNLYWIKSGKFVPAAILWVGEGDDDGEVVAETAYVAGT